MKVLFVTFCTKNNIMLIQYSGINHLHPAAWSKTLK